MGFGIKELVVVLVIVLLLFGTKKLKNIGGDLGGAIKGFRKSMTDDDATAALEEDAEDAAGETTDENGENPSAQKTAEHNDTKA